jgi:proteasome lid subunit RPN8/RPN11
VIELRPEHLQAIARAAEAAYPEECCGLLVGIVDGDDRRVTRVEPSTNVFEGDHRRRFEVDPRLILRLQRELRGGAEQLIGLYHSHPDGPGEPSATDLAKAWEPDLVWLITPVVNGHAAPTSAHQPTTHGGFRELPLRHAGATIET